jgi:hypothetical protein
MRFTCLTHRSGAILYSVAFRPTKLYTPVILHRLYNALKQMGHNQYLIRCRRHEVPVDFLSKVFVNTYSFHLSTSDKETASEAANMRIECSNVRKVY